MPGNEMLHNFVDGASRPSGAVAATRLTDPRTAEPGALSPISTGDDVDQACLAAEAASASWGRRTPGYWQGAMLDLADALLERREQIAETQARNTGQPLELIEQEEVVAGVDAIRFYAGTARLADGRAAGEYVEGYTSYVRREPVGVVAQVTPWNYPFLMAAWKIAPALATGNAIVLKPSDTTPESTLLLAEIAGEVLPRGVLNVVQGDATTGAALVAHRVPGLVAITGSVAAGISVAQGAAPSLKRVHLELGGKAPAIVMPDADVERAAIGIVDSAMFNSGQDCTAASRAIVHQDVVDEFTAAATARAGSYTPDTGELAYGPLNNDTHYRRVLGMLERLGPHVTVKTGGVALERPGHYLAPTVLEGVRQEDEVVQREVFGPVLTIQRFATESQALALANGVPYGLAASVWTQRHDIVSRMTRDLAFGAVWVNAHTVLTAEMPHGGFGMSGYGKDLSVYGLEEYSRIKHVMINHESTNVA